MRLKGAAVGIVLLAPLLPSQEPAPRSGFVAAFGVGAVSAQLDCSSCGGDWPTRAGVRLMLAGAYRPSLVLGFEGIAYRRNAGDIKDTFAWLGPVASWYPSRTLGAHLRAGAGLAIADRSTPLDTLEAISAGGLLGAGYDIRVRRGLSLTPYASWVVARRGKWLGPTGAARTEAVRGQLLTAGLALTWH